MSKMKYLWTAALIALCVTVMSTAAFAQASWDATADDGFPDAMVWDETADVTIDADNDGSTAWDTTYALWSIEGTTDSPVPIDRWGLDMAPEDGITPTVAAAGSMTFEFTITAPPITTLEYLEAEEVTSAVDDLECDWLMHEPGGYVLTDIVEKDIVISRFPDDQPGSIGAWARHSIEMLAGRVPMIVRGFPDGSYGPQLTVSRDQMAVFAFRAAKLDATTPEEATFGDVPNTGYGDEGDEPYWAYTAIESCVAAGIVEGYSATVYAPANAVTRAQMAVFVARALDYTLTSPADPSFPDDVPLGFWAYDEIETCVLNGIVAGYPDGLYRPTAILSRDQMAVFVDRSFILPTGQPIVLGGPDVTIVDVPAADTAGWYGYSHYEDDPSTAYVLFDTARLDTNLCAGLNGTWDITFTFREGTGTTVVGVPTTVNVAEGDITTATGTYFVVSTGVPGLAAGDYNLAVSVEDETATMNELARKPTFTAP